MRASMDVNVRATLVPSRRADTQYLEEMTLLVYNDTV